MGIFTQPLNQNPPPNLRRKNKDTDGGSDWDDDDVFKFNDDSILNRDNDNPFGFNSSSSDRYDYNRLNNYNSYDSGGGSDSGGDSDGGGGGDD